MTLPRTLPDARVPDPNNVPELRWGVLGTGWIADKFFDTLGRNTNQRLTAVGSRSQNGADRFSATHGGTPHGSYEALVEDPNVDVVYVSTPHPQHEEHALLAIAAGKHVLIEKPVAISARGGKRIAEAAKAAGVFAMEAYWPLFLPKFSVIKQLLGDGVLGNISLVAADLGEYFDADHRIHDPALAGGAMMDLAVYPVGLATWVLGEQPGGVLAQGLRGSTGTVAQVTMGLQYASAQATLFASTLAETPTRAYIGGDEAMLEMPTHWYGPGDFLVRDRGGRELRYEEPATRHEGLFWEAVHVAECIGSGQTMSDVRPMSSSVATLAVMDEVRRQTGDVLVGE